MKKTIILALTALMAATSVSAQRAGEYDLRSSDDIKGYNRLGITYNNTSYHNNWKEKDGNYSANGIGINYLHGFSLSSSLPMFVEAGLNVNFDFATPYSDEDRYGREYEKFTNMNFQVPVNYSYRFAIMDEFSIAPFIGINFKIHALMNGKEVEEDSDGEKIYDNKWSYFDKDKMGKDGVYNRFQMGWQIGATFQYSRVYLTVQYGTDFIPAWSYKKDKINTGNLHLGLGFAF
ncbi:MAG: outer membrane beta-barrel protein [Muribaculaceae bacterium]|nr:outer membrane beta-barrel protein [Muribaculaceae bacterium]